MISLSKLSKNNFLVYKRIDDLRHPSYLKVNFSFSKKNYRMLCGSGGDPREVMWKTRDSEQSI